jgi:hypothetical protein
MRINALFILILRERPLTDLFRHRSSLFVNRGGQYQIISLMIKPDLADKLVAPRSGRANLQNPYQWPWLNNPNFRLATGLHVLIVLTFEIEIIG